MQKQLSYNHETCNKTTTTLLVKLCLVQKTHPGQVNDNYVITYSSCHFGLFNLRPALDSLGCALQLGCGSAGTSSVHIGSVKLCASVTGLEPTWSG